MNIINFNIVPVIKPDDQIKVVAAIRATDIICFRRAADRFIEMDVAKDRNTEGLFRLRKGEKAGDHVLEPVGIEDQKDADVPSDFLTHEFVESLNRLVFAYRDTDLPEEAAAKYLPGKVLTEGGFLDASRFPGKPYRNTRFLIASSNFRDLSPLSFGNRSFPHLTLQAGATLLAIDICKIDGCRQIALLAASSQVKTLILHHESHPEMKRFVNQLAQAFRNDFAARWKEPILDEIANDSNWNQRVGGPIGF